MGTRRCMSLGHGSVRSANDEKSISSPSVEDTPLIVARAQTIAISIIQPAEPCHQSLLSGVLGFPMRQAVHLPPYWRPCGPRGVRPERSFAICPYRHPSLAILSYVASQSPISNVLVGRMRATMLIPQIPSIPILPHLLSLVSTTAIKPVKSFPKCLFTRRVNSSPRRSNRVPTPLRPAAAVQVARTGMAVVRDFR